MIILRCDMGLNCIWIGSRVYPMEEEVLGHVLR